MPQLQAITSAASTVLSTNGRVFDNMARENGEERFQDVSLEEILYEAKLQREREKSTEWGEAAPTVPMINLIKTIFMGKTNKKEPTGQDKEKPTGQDKEKNVVLENEVTQDLISEPTNTSIDNANRMVKSASWGSVFFLITTDILGPTSAPYSISQLGYVPGALLFFLFGIAAMYCGYLLWKIYLKLDSEKYPLKTYGDIVGRIYGPRVRYGVDFLQCLQLLCSVSVIILGNGQGLSQITKGKGCYTVLILVWSLAGMIIGQIRSLQRFGFLANLAIWMNVFVIIATMASVSHSAPNYVAAAGTMGIKKGPVITKIIMSGSGSTAFTNQLSACMNIVYSYGGAMVFVELMSEMKRPWDFWKGMITAQVFISIVYLFYGLFVYSQQGQFVVNPANQGISAYTIQTVANIVNLVSALIAAGLYGNVGIKVFYQTFFQKVFHTPDITSKKGRYIWCIAIIMYWGFAFILASAIPQFSALTSLVGAVCILQFTYTFPAILIFGIDLQIGALAGDGEYDPISKSTNRVDSWKNASRWIRAFKAKWLLNTCHIVLFLASLATAILGIYSSAELLKESFASGITTSFTCKSPVA